MTSCAIVRCPDYGMDNLRQAILRIIESTDFPAVKGKTVLIKPNILSDAPPEKAITTDARAVEALVAILKERGAGRIIIGDSPATQVASLQPRASGFMEMAERQGIELADFRERNRMHAIDGIDVPMASALDEAAIVISFAKAKTHQLMSATGAVKNMFGTIPGLSKSPMHLRYREPVSFARFLMKLYDECHVDYAFLDAVIAMEGQGPGSGTPRHAGLMIGSASGYAVDRAEGIIMGYDSTPLIETAEKLRPGISEASYPLLRPEDLIIPGYRRIESGKKDTFRTLVLGSVRNLFRRPSSRRPRPSFDAGKCRACSRCVSICPAKALRIENGHIAFTKRRCIRCYCCHEVCPFDAINV